MTDLKRFRLLREVTQTELARRIRITQPTISDFERGRLEPGPDLRARISKALAVPEEQIYGEAK